MATPPRKPQPRKRQAGKRAAPATTEPPAKTKAKGKTTAEPPVKAKGKATAKAKAPAKAKPAARSPAPRPADSSTRATRVLGWLLHKLPARRREKALDYLVLTRMDRPIGALLLLWPTWWALWLAAGDFP